MFLYQSCSYWLYSFFSFRKKQDVQLGRNVFLRRATNNLKDYMLKSVILQELFLIIYTQCLNYLLEQIINKYSNIFLIC